MIPGLWVQDPLGIQESAYHKFLIILMSPGMWMQFSLSHFSLSEDLRIGPPCGRPRAGKEARKFLSQLDSHGMQCQAQTYTLTVAITEEAK